MELQGRLQTGDNDWKGACRSPSEATLQDEVTTSALRLFTDFLEAVAMRAGVPGCSQRDSFGLPHSRRQRSARIEIAAEQETPILRSPATDVCAAEIQVRLHSAPFSISCFTRCRRTANYRGRSGQRNNWAPVLVHVLPLAAPSLASPDKHVTVTARRRYLQ